jgi:hypothetical protein
MAAAGEALEERLKGVSINLTTKHLQNQNFVPKGLRNSAHKAQYIAIDRMARSLVGFIPQLNQG